MPLLSLFPLLYVYLLCDGDVVCIFCIFCFICYFSQDERFDYASKLKSSIEHLRKSGELLAKYQLEKQIAASREDFQRAKEKKTQMDTYRDNLYKTLRIKQLLEPNGVKIKLSHAFFPQFFLFVLK